MRYRRPLDFRADEKAAPADHRTEAPSAEAAGADPQYAAALRMQRAGGNRATESILQRAPAAPAAEETGLPPAVQAGIERLSGLDLSATRVRYDSPKPERLGKLAYTQGHQIEMAPGQDEHVAHEAWHVVQQMQGRVRATASADGEAANDDAALEHEADQMAAKAVAGQRGTKRPQRASQVAPVPALAGAGAGPTRGVLQALNKCVECGHKHTTTCTVKNKDGNPCGCKSHSSKWDSGSKQTGGGKRERRRQAMGGNVNG